MSYCVEHVMPRICVVRSALPSETSQSPGVCCPCLFIRCADEWRPATRRDHPRVRSGCRPKGVRCTGQRVRPGRRPLRGPGGHPPDKSGPVTWPRTCLRRCTMDRFLLLTARIDLTPIWPPHPLNEIFGSTPTIGSQIAPAITTTASGLALAGRVA